MDYTKHHYEETLKLLIVISSESNVQLEAHGIGNAEEEMAIDLAFHFTDHKESLVNEGYFSVDEANAIEEINTFFESRNNELHESFWYELESHSDWAELRQLAKNILTKMGKDNLAIQVDVKNETSWFSKNVTSQQITVTLVDKNT